MKKIYETPELEVSKFSLAADVLAVSTPENDLPEFDDDLNIINGPGYGWRA